jgi:hypothetical protein
MIAAAALLTMPAAFAQSNAEVNSGVQFNFASPGARSLGIGGAFVGLADDATTAYANPAGLVNVVTPEVSGEFRGWQYTNRFPTGGHAFGPPSNVGVDTIAGIEKGTSVTRELGFSFASVVYPQEGWAFAVYRHKLADLKVSSETRGFFYTLPDLPGPPPLPGDSNSARAAPSRSHMDVQIVGYGVSGAYRINDRLSLGLSAARYALTMDGETLRYSASGAGPPTYEKVVHTQTQSGSDTAITFNGGLLWQATNAITIGATYRQASAFEVEVSSDSSPDVCRGAFNVPDVAALGASFLLPYDVTVAADYDHIRYSRLTRHFVAFDQKNVCAEQTRAVDYSVKDVGEIHLGVAKALRLRGHGIVFSAGWWNEPSHTMEFRDPTRAEHVLFDRGTTDNHFSVGLGFNLDSHRQIYTAFETSRRQRVLSVSALARF